MTKNITYLTCLLIIILDIVAGILGIQAEIAENKVQNLRLWIFECQDPSYQAFKLGISAVVMLCISHVVVNLLGGCIVIQSKEELDRSSPNKKLAAASLILSWIMLGIGFILLMSGTLANSHARENCGITRHRQLSIGGIICFIHGLFAVAYIVSAAVVVEEERTLLHQQPTKPNDEQTPAANA